MGLFGFGKKKEAGKGTKKEAIKECGMKENEDQSEVIPESELLTGMAEQLGYPYRPLPMNLTPEQLMEVYKEALERGKKEGFTPVLIPEDDILEEYFGILKDEEEYSVKTALEQIGDNGREILKERLKELIESEEELEALEGEFPVEPAGREADEELTSHSEFISLFEPGGEKMLPAILVEVPTGNPWEVAAYVPFGGWNECPAPEEMAAICKYWYEKYAAVPAVITHDTLEMLLPESVKREEAMELAKEHYSFCNDRVDQCTSTGTLGEVADSLWRSRVWYFWWD